MTDSTLDYFGSTFHFPPVRKAVPTRAMEILFTNQTFSKVNSKQLFFFTFLSIHLPTV